jgi:hypothetical protein
MDLELAPMRFGEPFERRPCGLGQRPLLGFRSGHQITSRDGLCGRRRTVPRKRASDKDRPSAPLVQQLFLDIGRPFAGGDQAKQGLVHVEAQAPEQPP